MPSHTKKLLCSSKSPEKIIYLMNALGVLGILERTGNCKGQTWQLCFDLKSISHYHSGKGNRTGTAMRVWLVSIM